MVAEDGQVVNRTVTFADEVSADELAGAQNLLNRVLAGHSARDVRRSMDAGTVEALSDPLVQLIYAIGAVTGLIGGIRVYQKFSSGDPDTSKTAASWFGACIFLILVGTVLESFFF